MPLIAVAPEDAHVVPVLARSPIVVWVLAEVVALRAHGRRRCVQLPGERRGQWLRLRRRWQRPLPLTGLTATSRNGHLEPVRQSSNVRSCRGTRGLSPLRPHQVGPARHGRPTNPCSTVRLAGRLGSSTCQPPLPRPRPAPHWPRRQQTHSDAGSARDRRSHPAPPARRHHHGQAWDQPRPTAFDRRSPKPLSQPETARPASGRPGDGRGTGQSLDTKRLTLMSGR